MMKSALLQMRAVLAIARNTFREAIRNKILGALLLCAAGVMAFSLVLGAMSLHHEVRVATDVGLFASTVFAMLITVYVSINLVQTEIERRTIYTILSKPVRRWQFLLGKFLGILLLVGAILLLLFAVSAGLRLFQGGAVTLPFAWSYLLVFFQMMIVASISLLFASFSSPLLSGLLSAGVFVAGHLHSQLELVADFFEIEAVRTTVGFLEFVVPNLSSMNTATEVVRDIPIPPTYLLNAAWYTASYSALVLLLAMLIFQRRDLV